MADEKKQMWFNGFIPVFNGFPLPPIPFMFNADGKEKSEFETKFDKKKVDEKVDDFESKMMSVWNQLIDMQKSTIDSSKDWSEQLYDHVMKVQDIFTESLPEEFPVPAGFMPLPVSPKEFMDQVKKFQKMSKEHVEEQADSVSDFVIKSQTQMRDAASKTTDKASKQRKEFSNKKSEAKAESSRKKTASAKKTESSRKKTASAKKTEKEPEPSVTESF